MSPFRLRPRTRRRDSWLSILCALAFGTLPLIAVTTASAQSSAPPGLAGGLAVQDAWIRWLPSGLPEGGYVTLVNHSAQTLVLIGASSAAYGEIALHRSLQINGMSHMSMVDKITIPGHSTLSFAAAGYHLMLMQPQQTLAPGAHVQITLKFAGGDSRTVEFELREPNGAAAAHGDMSGTHELNNMPGMAH